jgi:hypothetical protein
MAADPRGLPANLEDTLAQFDSVMAESPDVKSRVMVVNGRLAFSMNLLPWKDREGFMCHSLSLVTSPAIRRSFKLFSRVWQVALLYVFTAEDVFRICVELPADDTDSRDILLSLGFRWLISADKVQLTYEFTCTRISFSPYF